MSEKKFTKKYEVVGRFTLGSANVAGQIRIKIPADSQPEAEQKFKEILQTKTVPVVDSCRELTVNEQFQDTLNNILKGWK